MTETPRELCDARAAAPHAEAARRASARMAVAMVSVGALLLSVYVRTLLPGVGLGDTAELQTCAARPAIPHAPGYPLEVLLLRAFDSLVPFGTAAWRANLASALCMCAAALVLLRTLVERRASVLASSGIALAFGFALPVWDEATAAEVYALQLLLLALATRAWLTFRESDTARTPSAALAWTALAVTHHPLCAFALPGFALLAWSADGWRGFARRAALLLAFGLAAAAVLYGWLAWRWRSHELVYSAMRIDSFERFWFEVSGGQFRGRMLGVSPDELVERRLPQFLALLGRALAWLAPLAVLGWLAPARRGVRAALLLLALVPALYAATYRIEDIEPYFLPTLLALFVSAGVGLAWCEARIARAHWLGAALAFALAACALAWNFARADRREQQRFETQARALLARVDRDALIVWPEAPASQLLWHLLLADGGEVRNVHVVHDRDVRALRDYVQGRAPIFERHTRATIPLDLTPYCIDAAIADALRERGFALEPLGERLWRIDTAPAAASTPLR